MGPYHAWRGDIMPQQFDYVIVGGGAAAATAVEGIRQHDERGSIAVFTREWAPPYQRPPLSKEFLQARAGIESVLMQPATWYSERNAAVHVGTDIASIQPAEHAVTAGDGRIGYRKLLLATGAVPRRLTVAGADLEGVFTLRSYLDGERLRAVRATAERIVVVGSGFIGMEVAASLRSGGAEVTVVTVDEQLYRQFGAAVSTFAKGLFDRHGVQTHFKTTLRSIDGEGRVGGVTLDDGTQLEADAVVIGIGVTPETSLADAAGLHVENGIVVDDRLRSSAPDVYAAGDVARFPSYRGALTRVEHFDHAYASGSAAGANMAGADQPYRYVPFFWSDVFELGFEFVGDAAADARVSAGSVESGSFVVEYYDRARLAGALLAMRSGEERDAYRERISSSSAG
ncbi:NAD(P)/FAD-dependent oxidoreductase [bacterium]|nr:MAG: NAD(P)/FAD-dependent oxidoreductase [bacterium]